MASSNYKGGLTIHSGFKLLPRPLGPKALGRVRKALKEAKCVVIDEIGNVRFDLFNAVINTIRRAEFEQNRKIGRIVKVNKNSLKVHLLSLDRDVLIKPHTVYAEKSKDRLTLYPIVPAYAVTIHCVQGQTLDKAYVHADCFERYQLYTALSRVTSSEGLTIIGEINKDSFGRR